MSRTSVPDTPSQASTAVRVASISMGGWADQMARSTLWRSTFMVCPVRAVAARPGYRGRLTTWWVLCGTGVCKSCFMASHQADPAAAQRAAAEVEAVAEALVGIWAHVAESLDVRVSPTQLRALTAVGRYGELNLSQLAEALGALPSSASRLCDRLEAAGLLTRDTGRASRRAVSLRLTPEGEALLEQARTRRQEQIAQVLDAMSPADRAGLAQGLVALQHAAEPEGMTTVSSDG